MIQIVTYFSNALTFHYSSLKTVINFSTTYCKAAEAEKAVCKQAAEAALALVIQLCYTQAHLQNYKQYQEESLDSSFRFNSIGDGMSACP